MVKKKLPKHFTYHDILGSLRVDRHVQLAEAILPFTSREAQRV